MTPGLLLPFVLLAAVLLTVTVARPRFWVPKQLPFDQDDVTRGDWHQIPSHGAPRDGD